MGRLSGRYKECPCGERFWVAPYQEKNGVGKFCSKPCMYQGRAYPPAGTRPGRQPMAVPYAPGVMVVPMNHGRACIIDADDGPLAARYTWREGPGNHTDYANTDMLKTGSTTDRFVQSMHRLFLGLDFGDKRQGDHINGNGLDNRRANLRIAPNGQRQNGLNRGPNRGGSSRFKGVFWNKQAGRWTASIKAGEIVWRHNFAGEAEAARAYDDKARELHGEFAYLNFPDER